ncbi:MAG: hypothetical protein LBC42_02820 [Puniceicoccales bacterium]|nr:hypothetical protein [Puniceicoccales bacterium]
MLPFDSGNNEKGLICAANESRFMTANYSEPLTTFTVGWKDGENVEELLNFVAPVVHVGKRFEFKKANNGEMFLSEEDDVRAVGAAFKRIEFSGSTVMEKTLNKGLTVRIDHDDVAGDDWQERYVQLLLRRLYRNELRRAIGALDGAAAETAENVSWSEADGPNPDADIRRVLAAAADSVGVRPNRVLYGEGAWDIRSNVYDTQATAAAQRAATLSLEDLARKFFVDKICVFGARYRSGLTHQTIVGNEVYIFNTRNDIVKDEPADIKRFVTPIDGHNFRVYVEEHSKYTDITVEHYSHIVVTSPAGIRKLIVATAE